MRLQEGSRVRGMLRRCWERMLCASVGSLCAAVFFAATACLAVTVLRMGRIPDGAAVLAPAVVLLSMLPGLGERRSLSHCLREGRLTAPFLFGFCGLLPDGFGEGGAGRVHRFLPLLCGVPVGVAGAFLPPLVLPGMACGAAVWFLLRAVPELSVLLLALSFPFLPLLPHPTVLLATGTVLSLAVFAGKWISGRRTLRFGRIDRAALAFGAVCLLAGGVSGAVSALLIAGGWMSVRSPGRAVADAGGGMSDSVRFFECVYRYFGVWHRSGGAPVGGRQPLFGYRRQGLRNLFQSEYPGGFSSPDLSAGALRCGTVRHPFRTGNFGHRCGGNRNLYGADVVARGVARNAGGNRAVSAFVQPAEPVASASVTVSCRRVSAASAAQHDQPV